MNLVGIVLKDKSHRTRKPSNVLISYLKSRSIEYFIIVSKNGVIEESVLEKIPVSTLCVTFGGDVLSSMQLEFFHSTEFR